MRNCLLHVNGSRLGAGGRDIYRTNTFALRASAGHTAQHIQEPPFQTEENIWKDPRICPSVKLWKFSSLKLNVDRSKVWICSICSDHVVAPIFLGHFWNLFGPSKVWRRRISPWGYSGHKTTSILIGPFFGTFLLCHFSSGPFTLRTLQGLNVQRISLRMQWPCNYINLRTLLLWREFGSTSALFFEKGTISNKLHSLWRRQVVLHSAHVG